MRKIFAGIVAIATLAGCAAGPATGATPVTVAPDRLEAALGTYARLHPRAREAGGEAAIASRALKALLDH